MPTTETTNPSAELPHTLVVERTPLIRLYLWTYATSINSINTCKLFWAFLLLPIALPISVFFHLVGPILVPFIENIDYKLEENKARKAEIPVELTTAKTGPSRAERLLNKIAAAASVIWFKVQPALKWLGIAGGLAVAALLAYVIIAFTGRFLEVLLIMGLTAAGFLLLIAIITPIVIYFEKHPRKNKGLLRKLGRSFHEHTCANVKVKR